MNYIKLDFAIRSEEDADIISALLSPFEVQGFEQNDDYIQAFFYEEKFDEAAIKEVLSPFEYVYQLTTIPHENWNAQWESNFEPIRINDEVGVRAIFHPPFVDCVYDIVITPKMSFGTGHHETTQMMLQFISEIECASKSVFDFGCGTGVLAIFAKMKGAEKVIGIDNDAWSVENAKENCMMNKCAEIKISDDDISILNDKFDLIIANINLNVLIENMGHLRKLLKNGGDIFMSGVLQSDTDQLLGHIHEAGFKLISSKQQNNWMALHIN